MAKSKMTAAEKAERAATRKAESEARKSAKKIGECERKLEKKKSMGHGVNTKQTSDCGVIGRMPIACRRSPGQILLDDAPKPWDVRGAHFINKSGEVLHGKEVVGTGHKLRRPWEERQLSFTYHEAKEGSKNKMAQMVSLSTSPYDNPFCMELNYQGCKDKATGNPHPIICGDCYSVQQMGYRGISTSGPYVRNGQLMASSILCEEYLPELLPGESIRFNANGELINEIHFSNLLNITEYNPHSECVLFTKRWRVIDTVFKCRDKPENLTIIYSNPYVDDPISFDDHELEYDRRKLIPSDNSFWWVDGIFNVVKNREPSEYRFMTHGEQKFVGCALDCIACYKCYMRKKHFVVVERIKEPGGEDRRKKMEDKEMEL